MTEIAKTVMISKTRNTLHSFFSLKVQERDEDKAKVEAIRKALNKAGITITFKACGVEKWGKTKIPKDKTLVTDYALLATQQCDCNIIEFSEKSVELGINVGYCYAIGKPIFIIAKTGSNIPTTISNLVAKVIFYNTPDDLVEPFKQIVADFNLHKVNTELRKHIETVVFPEYDKNEPAHNLSHIKYVIDRSFKFAQAIPGISYDIVYVVAAYHDIGHHIDPKRHEIVSAEIMKKDKKTERFLFQRRIENDKRGYRGSSSFFRP